MAGQAPPEDNTQVLEVKDPEIDVRQIMQKIREGMKRTQETGPLPPDDFPQESAYHFPSVELDKLIQKWDIWADDPITSHRGVAGRFIVIVKKIHRALFRPFNKELLKKQRDFNLALIAALHNMLAHIRNLTVMLMDNRNLSMTTQERLEEISREVSLVLSKFADFLRQTKEHTGGGVALRAEAAEKSLEDLSYLRFENVFAKTREVKKKQNIYLPYFRNTGDILDIGCGRGEFLELLKEHGMHGKGIDSNEDMVKICSQKGLDAVCENAFDFLRSLGDGSLGGIFCSQVVEHLSHREIAELLSLSFRKLRENGVIIAETMNPRSFTALQNFYLDPTHVKPVHPEGLKFMMSATGFKNIEVKFLNPIPEDQRLKFLTDPRDEFQRIFNENTGLLNDIIFGYYDYAVIAAK